MRDVVLLLVHALTIVVRLARPGGARSILAESVFLKHQLLVLNRSRRRAPNLLPVDRLIAGLCALLVVPRRLARCAIVVKPSTFVESSSRSHPALPSSALRPRWRLRSEEQNVSPWPDREYRRRSYRCSLRFRSSPKFRTKEKLLRCRKAADPRCTNLKGEIPSISAREAGIRFQANAAANVTGDEPLRLSAVRCLPGVSVRKPERRLSFTIDETRGEISDKQFFTPGLELSLDRPKFQSKIRVAFAVGLSWIHGTPPREHLLLPIL